MELLATRRLARVRAGQGGGAKEAQMDRVREELGLNDPIPVQYFNYVKNALQGNLGRSIRTNEPVSTMITRNFSPTLKLTLASMLFAIVFGGLLGMFAAIKRGTILDNL